MAEPSKTYVDGKSNDGKNKIAPKSTKIAQKTFRQELKDAFISPEVHDVKRYIVFDVVIPAVKQTFRNLIVNTLDMSLFGSVRANQKPGQQGNTTYVQYDRAYNSQNDYTKPKKAAGSYIRVNELNRIVFEDKNDAIEVLNYLFSNIEEYNVASVADFISAAKQDVVSIHHKWGWYDLKGSSVEELPDGRGYWISMPHPQAI